MSKPQVPVEIGKNPQIDEGVVLGYTPEREVKNYQLRIGDQARIRQGTILYGGSSIGDRFQAGHHVIVREEVQIGDDCVIAGSSIIDYKVKLGNRVKIHSHVYVAQFTVIEDDVFLAPGVMIANDKHPGSPDSRQKLCGPTIKKGAQIGINVTILPGVTIGEKAIVGAGSVVTKDIPAFSVVAGNPAKVLNK